MIADEWRSYETQVIPGAASKVQRQECRRAFYAGARSLLHTMMEHLDPGSDPTVADMRRMDEIDEELEQFQRDILSGKA